MFSLSEMEFTIFVKALDGDGKFMTLRVKETTTILNVKEMIEEISTVPVSWLHLSLWEKKAEQLEDSWRLQYQRRSSFDVECQHQRV